MVDYHRAVTPRAIVVKRGRRSAAIARRPVCLWPGCKVRLASDHDDPVCAHHVGPAYNPRHDAGLPTLIRHLVIAAYPDAVDLCAVLRCESHDLEAALKWLRRRDCKIIGARRGYVYELSPLSVDRPSRGRHTVKA